MTFVAMTNVFKIRNNKETYVYRCELSSDKKLLLAQFRQVAEELAARRRKEREGEHERRKTLWVGGGGDVWMHPILKYIRKLNDITRRGVLLLLIWTLPLQNG